MTVINILKDGTVVDDMSKVAVPNELIANVMKILERKEREERGKNHG